MQQSARSTFLFQQPLIGILLLAMVAWSACENDPAEVAALFPDVRPDAELIREFETIYSDSAKVRVRIQGPLMMRYYENGQYIQLFPEGARVEFFNDFGQVGSTMTSGYGIRFENEERVIVRDSVVWVSDEGDRLDTEELVWEAESEKIFSDRFVRLRQADKEITGIGFESNQNFTRSKVIAIQGIVNVEDRKGEPSNLNPVDSSNVL